MHEEIFEALERDGLTQTHILMLLHFLASEQTGTITWLFDDGYVRPETWQWPLATEGV